MARVLVAPAARDQLQRLIRTHSLPSDTKDRVKRSLERLGRFPLLGRPIEQGRWSGYRFVLGPWRWLIILHQYARRPTRSSSPPSRTAARPPRTPHLAELVYPSTHVSHQR